MFWVTEEMKEKINLFMEENRESMVKMLTELVRIPSVMGEAKSGALFGEGPERMLEKAEEIFRTEGFPVKKEEEYVLAEYGEGEKSIGIFTHGDVVPPGNDWSITEPFSPVIRDGFIIGRGVSDNKSGIVEMLYAVKAIRALGLSLKHKLSLFVGTNEESGMEDVKAFVRREETPAVSIVPDAAYPYISGEKGRAVVYLDSKKPFRFIRTLRSGEAVNCVSDFAEVRIPYHKEAYEMLSTMTGIKCMAEKDEIIINAKGKSAHASTPELGENAFSALAAALAECACIPEEERSVLKEAAVFTGDIYGKCFSIEREDAVFGRLTSTNGIAYTENGHLSLSFDIRFGGNFCKEIIKKLSALDGWTVRPVDVSDGYYRENLPAGRVLGETADHFIGSGSRGLTMGIGTYARHLPNAFPVGTSVKTKEPPVRKPGHGGAHQPDELLDIDGFIESAKILTCMILELDAALEKQ